MNRYKTKIFLQKRQIDELKGMQSNETTILMKENRILNENIAGLRVANFRIKEKIKDLKRLSS